MKNKEELVIVAADPENISAAKLVEPSYIQSCLLCDNTREIHYPTHSLWVCDECKEAIAFVKEFMAGIKKVPADKAKEIEVSIALL